MPSVTINREVAVHFWPVERNAPSITCSTARSMSASSRTTAAFLPPISACTGTPRAAAAAAIRRPMPVDPVKVMASMSRWPTIAVADVRTADEQVEHTGGQSRVGQRLREPNRQQRHRAGGLPHHGVAVDQRGRDLPGRDRDREVERGDDADDADRLAGHQDLLAGAGRGEDLAGLAVALVAVVAQDLRGAAHLADRLRPSSCLPRRPAPAPRLRRCAPPRLPRPAAPRRAGGSVWRAHDAARRRPRRRRRRHRRSPAVRAFGHDRARPGGIDAAQQRRRCRRANGRQRGVRSGRMWSSVGHQRNAAWPVRALPMDSRCISEVPS